MPDVQEVFRMATQKVRPDPEALERQRRKQRGKLVRERVAVYALAAGLIAGGVVVTISALRSSDEPAVPASQAPEPSVSPESSPDMQPPLTERFDSPLHGVSIGYPSGWRTRAATEPWGHGDVAFGAPDVDVIFHPTLRDELYFAVFSEPLGGRSGRDWVGADLPPSLRACDRDDGSDYLGTDYILRGESAYGFFISCGSPVAGAGGHFVRVPTATRGYVIYLHVEDERRLQATYDREWFEAALETVDLRPEDALNPSESP